MIYTVKHFHKKLFGYKTVDEITAPDVPTVYQVEAETPLQAAKKAHALYNGCDDFSKGKEYRSTFERLTDDIAEDREYYRIFGKRDNVHRFDYDDVAGHGIHVNEGTT